MRVTDSSTVSRDVCAALLTPSGRGALAVVGVAGGDAAAVVDRVFAARGGRPVAGRGEGEIAVGQWRSTGEEVVVVRSEGVVEVHCHGGVAAAEAVLASLAAAGAEVVPWWRWLRVAGKSQIVVEAHEALAIAGGPRAARILARQAAGALEAEMDRIERLRRDGDHATAAAAIERLMSAGRVGLRLMRPWRVVLVGRVNAGKSSLANALAGHARSIVSAEPGTTRDLVETRLVLDGWEVDLVDTAGERGADESARAVEAAGMARAAAAAADADLVVRVAAADAGEPHAAADELLVVSKIDLAPQQARWPSAAVPTSATTGAGIAELAAAIVDRLVAEQAADPVLLAGAVPFTQRQVDAIGRLRNPPTSPPTSDRG